MADDSEWLKLPAEEKIEHKVWKARVAGYEELIKVFTKADDKSSEFPKYQGLVKKFVVDNNAIAQEKGLEAAIAYIQNAPTNLTGRIASDLSQAVVAKTLGAPRAKTKENGQELLMLVIEAEKPDIVQEELLKGLENKQPKLVAACVQTLREALRLFGSKVFPCKGIVKQIPRLLEDRDKNVRDETKSLTVEIYRWIGAVVKTQLTGLKPLQLTDLETEFDKLEPGTPRPLRYLRSQQHLQAAVEENAVDGAEGNDLEQDQGDAVEQMDPFDLLDPVDILSKLPADFQEKIEAKKWQERREVLDTLQQLLDKHPKLEPSCDYHDLVRALKRVLGKDANVLLVSAAAKSLSCLAAGLRKKFSSHAPGVIDTSLEKFREKKLAVVTSLKECVDACFKTTTLDAISETIIPYLDHKTPSVKAETASFLTRCFCQCNQATLPKKLLKVLIVPLVKLTAEQAVEVREATFEALGTAMKVVGEKNILALLSDVDVIKMNKIKEYEAKAVVSSGRKVDRAPAGDATATKLEAKPVNSARPSSVKPAAKPPVKARPATAPPAAAGGAAGKKKPKGAAKNKPPQAVKGADEIFTETLLSDESVDESLANILQEDDLKEIVSSNWKERLAAVEKLQEAVKKLPCEEVPIMAIFLLLTRKPGLKDNNLPVVKLKLELLLTVAKSGGRISKQSVDSCVQDLVEKIGDVKYGAAVQELLSCLAEATRLDYLSQVVVDTAFTQKSPKTQSEALNWVSTAIKEFGFKINVKPMINQIKAALSASNATVRSSAVSLIGILHMYMGPAAKMLFQDEKPTLLQLIDAEIEKIGTEKPPAPVRGLRQMENAEENEEEEEEGQEQMNVADLIPRVDISDKITPQLIEELTDKNWKIRNEALQKIEGILKEAKFIKADLGDLPPNLSIRLTKDSNKILVTTALGICQTLGTAIGPNIKQHVRTLGPAVVSCFGDTKPQLRQAAVGVLNTWLEQCGMACLMEAELFSESLKLENPTLRAELLGWLAEKLPICKKLPSTELIACLPNVCTCLEDRNATVRQKAQDLLGPLMAHTGYNAMFQQANKLKPASKDQVLALIEKYKGCIPVKAAVSAPSVVKAAAPAQQKKNLLPLPSAKVEKVDVDDADGRAAKGKGKVIGRKASTPNLPNTTTKKKEEEDTSPPMKANLKAKEQRFKDEKALKVLKWNFATPGPEFIQQLRAQMEPVFSKTFIELLFHIDFKNHLKAVDLLTTELTADGLSTTTCNLDLICKWLTLRFYDTNTTVLLKCLEYVQTLFSALAEQDYHVTELEAQAFIPHLIIKIGDPKDNVRRLVHTIIQSFCQIFPASKLFVFIIDGLKSKNAKQRAECLEELGRLISSYGVNICQPSPAAALKLIAGQISDRDNSVRSSALNTIVAAYWVLGDQVYKFIGKLTEKDQSMLEERIKRSNKPEVEKMMQPIPSTPGPSGDKAQTIRPIKTAPGKLANSQPQQRSPSKCKGEFQLEDEFQTVSSGPPEESLPQLVTHDYDEIFEPVVRPIPKIRPPSPSVKLLQQSSDVRLAVETAINHIASTDPKIALPALVQLDEVLGNPEKSPLLIVHVDQMVMMLSLQLRITHLRQFNIDVAADADDVIRAYRAVFSTVLLVFQNREMARIVSSHVLKDLLQNMLSVILDSRLTDIDDGPQVVRTANSTVVKIVEKSDPTAVMCTLIQMIHDCVNKGDVTSRYLELIMKCTWKMVRIMTTIVPHHMNIDKVLLEIHTFLKAFPMNTWSNRTSDMPVRTLKTILHNLAKIKGPQILTHLRLTEENSDVESFLKRVLRSTGNLSARAAGDGPEFDHANGLNLEFKADDMGTAESSVSTTSITTSNSSSSSDISSKLSKNTHDQLAEIFRKIGSKENTREGLMDLYDFKESHPDADLDPFLKKSSQFFQAYIQRGLVAVASERKKDGPKPEVKVNLTEPELNHTSTNPAHFRERLDELRRRCGLNSDDVENGQPASAASVRFALTENTLGTNSASSSNSSISSAVSSSLPKLSTEVKITRQENQGTAPISSASLEELKQKLDRFKKK